jgi:hypothetical protein
MAKPMYVINAFGKQPTYSVMSTHLDFLSSTRSTYAEDEKCRQQLGRET